MREREKGTDRKIEAASLQAYCRCTSAAASPSSFLTAKMPLPLWSEAAAVAVFLSPSGFISALRL